MYNKNKTKKHNISLSKEGTKMKRMEVKDERIQEKLQNEAKIKKIDKNFDGTFLSTILFVMICMGSAWKAFRWGMQSS